MATANSNYTLPTFMTTTNDIPRVFAMALDGERQSFREMGLATPRGGIIKIMSRILSVRKSIERLGHAYNALPRDPRRQSDPVLMLGVPFIPVSIEKCTLEIPQLTVRLIRQMIEHELFHLYAEHSALVKKLSNE